MIPKRNTADRKRRVVVTGGAGFIGSHLCDALLERQREVLCIDNLSGTGGSSRNIKHLEANPHFAFLNSDILTWAKNCDLSDVDCIYHLAASKNVVCMANPEKDLSVNSLGTLRLLRAACKHNVTKFVHASTGSVYGPPLRKQDESHPRNPVSFYGISKTAGESYCRMYGELYGLDCTVLRYFHVIGPRQDDSENGGVVAIFARRCLEGLPLIIYGTGEQVRSFTSVRDVVKATLWAGEGGMETQGCYNCASGIRVTIRELAEFVREETGFTVPVRHEQWRAGDIVHFDVDSSAIKSKGVSFNTDWSQVVREVISHKRSALHREADSQSSS